MTKYKEKNKRNKSTERGITLISLVVAVTIMLILTGMLVYNAKNGLKMQKLKMMQNDIEILDDKVDAYYIKYGALPAEIPYNVTPLTFEAQKGPNDNNQYYVLDLKAFEGLTLNYGLDFNNITTEEDLVNYDDIYVINEQSHKIYYVRGIEMDGVMYYTNDTDEAVSLHSIPDIEKPDEENPEDNPIEPPEQNEPKGNEITVEALAYNKIDTQKYEITLTNIQFNESYNLKVKEANNSEYTEIGTNLTDSNYTFQVDKYGLYYILLEEPDYNREKQLISSVYNKAEITEENVNVTMVKEITEDGIVTSNVAIPKGFTISGLDIECAQTILGVYEANEKKYTIDDGLVGYLMSGSTIDWSSTTAVENAKKTYDQFVWIPVLNAVLDLSGNTTALSTEENIKAAVQSEIEAGRYPMAIKKDATNYFGVLYEFNLNSEGNGVEISTLTEWTPLEIEGTEFGYREPAYLTNTADASSYNNVGITKNLLQEEYNSMVEKVNTKQGFWVGRYETSNISSSNSNDSSQRVKMIKGTSTGTCFVDWYRMYAQQKNYSKIAIGTTTTTTSSMIWGSQWDQIMIWMKEVPNETSYAGSTPFYILNSKGMGNYKAEAGGTGSIANTGYYEVKHIYDLAGNLEDWTLEADEIGARVERGGDYYYSGDTYTRPVYRLSYFDPGGSGEDNDCDGTRAVLY